VYSVLQVAVEEVFSATFFHRMETLLCFVPGLTAFSTKQAEYFHAKT